MKNRMHKKVTMLLVLPLFIFGPACRGLDNESANQFDEEANYLFNLDVRNIKQIRGFIHYQILSCRVTRPSSKTSASNKHLKIESTSLDELSIYKQGVIKVKETTLNISNIKITSGHYAVRVFQDINENQKLDLSSNSIPTEPVGFSKNPSLIFGVPDSSKACFRLDSDLKLNINLKNKRKRKRHKRR